MKTFPLTKKDKAGLSNIWLYNSACQHLLVVLFLATEAQESGLSVYFTSFALLVSSIKTSLPKLEVIILWCYEVQECREHYKPSQC